MCETRDCCKALPGEVASTMTRVCRGGYSFVTWKGDHSPLHVHVYRDGRLILKWDLDQHEVIEGTASRRLRTIIGRLEEEGTW